MSPHRSQRLAQAGRDEAALRAERAAAEHLPKPLLSGFSHAVRNSLNAIGLTMSNVVRQLRKEPPTPKRDDLAAQLELAVGEVEVARQLVIRFGSLLRPLKVQREWIAPSNLLDGALRESATLRKASAAIMVEAAPVADDEPVALDARLSREALEELLANAVDAMTPGGGCLRVSARRAGGELVIEVADSGSGISPPVQERAFEPFYTGRGGDKGGMGLSLARRFAEAQGGSVELESRAPEAGVVARMRLPVPDAAPGTR